MEGAFASPPSPPASSGASIPGWCTAGAPASSHQLIARLAEVTLSPAKKLAADRSKTSSEEAAGCSGPGPSGTRCGLMVVALGLCSSHRRHQLKDGKLKVLHKRRKPLKGYRQYGITWSSKASAEAVTRAAEKAQMSPNEFIADSMERLLGLKKTSPNR